MLHVDGLTFKGRYFPFVEELAAAVFGFSFLGLRASLLDRTCPFAILLPPVSSYRVVYSRKDEIQHMSALGRKRTLR